MRVGVRDWREEPCKPYATDVEGREDARAHHREDCHRLGGAVDRCPPVLPSQEKNRGDQRSGVADTDPENEVHDGPAPHHAVGVTPDADTRGNEVEQPAADTDQSDQRGREEQQPPEERLLVLDNPADPIRDPVIGAVVEDQLFALQDRELNSGVRLRGGFCGLRPLCQVKS